MRIESPSSCKTGRKHGKTTADGLPMNGGQTRKLYDYFIDRKGVPILNKTLLSVFGMKKNGQLNVMIYNLTDFWGLDIRSVPDCHYKCLCGEWFGSKYVDHIADKIKD